MHTAVTLLLGGPFLGGANEDFVALETGNLSVDHGHHPGTLAETGPLEKEAETEQNVRDRSGQKGHGKGRRHQLPRNGGDNGGNERTEQARVEEGLDTVRDAKDVLLVVVQLDGGDARHDKKAHGDAHLSAHHETGQVAGVALEEHVARFLGPRVEGAFLFGHAGDGKKGNLHALEHADNGHEDKKEDHRGGGWDTVPHGGLSVKEGRQGDGKGKGENGQGHEDAAPEKQFAEGRAGFLFGLERLARGPGKKHLHEIAAVQQSGNFNRHGHKEGERGKVVVDVVEHAPRRVDLGGDLGNHGRHEKQGQIGTQKDLGDDLGQSQHLGARDGFPAQVFNENQRQHHELAAHEVAIQIVAPVDHAHDLVRGRMRVLVEIHVDGRQADERGLSAFHHGQPNDGEPENKEGKDRTDVGGELGLIRENNGHDHDGREDQQSRRVDIAELFAKRRHHREGCYLD